MRMKIINFRRFYPPRGYTAIAIEVRPGSWAYPFAWETKGGLALSRGVVHEGEHSIEKIGDVLSKDGWVSFSVAPDSALEIYRRVGRQYKILSRKDDADVVGETGFEEGAGGLGVKPSQSIEISVDLKNWLDAVLPARTEPTSTVRDSDLLAIAKLIDKLLDGRWHDDPEAVEVFQIIDKHIDMFEYFGDAASPLPY